MEDITGATTLLGLMTFACVVVARSKRLNRTDKGVIGLLLILLIPLIWATVLRLL